MDKASKIWYNIDTKGKRGKDMEKQLNFADIEYANRRRTTKREEFLNKMDSVIPWNKWVKAIEPYYPKGKRGRRPQEIEKMLRMYLLQNWFNLSDEGVEDAIYDSYAMKQFMGVNFGANEQVPDATTLCKFRKLLNENHITEQLFKDVQDVLSEEGKMVQGGTIVDATIIAAPDTKKNKTTQSDPEMHTVKKGNKWYFGMRAHIGVDPLYGFVHTVVCTPANESEVKVAPNLLRPDDKVVYGDAGYLKMERYVEDDIERDYRINRQAGTFKLHYGDSLSWAEERKLEYRKSRVRCKVEFAFHIVKDIFKWRKARYRGIYKNHCQANILFACANLYMLLGFKATPCKG